MYSGSGDVPPTAIQIRGPSMWSESDDEEFHKAVAEIRELAESNEEFKIGIQEKDPGGAPVDSYLVIVAKSAAGAAGALAVKEFYHLIKRRYSEDENEDSDTPTINIGEVHVNLSGESKPVEELESEDNSLRR